MLLFDPMLEISSSAGQTVFNDNAFTECGNGIDVSVESNFVQYGGRNQQFMSCTNVFTNYNNTTMPLILDCPSIKGIVSHDGGGVVQNFSIMPTPLLVNGKCDIFIKRDGNTSPMYAATANIQINDAPTFIASREGKIQFNTTVAVNDPVFNDNAGTLELRLNSDDAIDLFYEIALRGYVYFSLQ